MIYRFLHMQCSHVLYCSHNGTLSLSKSHCWPKVHIQLKEMALPSYWLSVSRKDLAERAIVMRRELEAQRVQKYDSAARYFQNIDIQSSKYRELEQLNSYSTSRVNEESGKDEEAKAMKKVKLNDRKEKLTFLLKTENEELMREMKIKIGEEREKDPWNISSLKEQVEELRKKRQAEQKELAERKMYQQWKYNTPYIRELETKNLQRDVLRAWEDQKKEQERSAAKDREEENCFLAELEQQRQKAENAVQELEKKQVVESKKLAKHLQKQMEEVKEKNIESEKLKAEEAELLKYQNIIDTVQERRKQLQEIEKKEVLRISLLRQSKDKLRKMALEVQRELELDCQMLDYLGQLEARQQQKETSRRKLAMTDVQWMREIISEQQALEKARESELQVLYQEEAARMWEKRDAEWNRERKARDTLMKEILEGLQKQIEEKRAHNFKTQEGMLKKREDALNSLYKANQNAKEEEHKMILEKRQYQNEMERLERIVQSNSVLESKFTP